MVMTWHPFSLILSITLSSWYKNTMDFDPGWLAPRTKRQGEKDYARDIAYEPEDESPD